MSVREFFLIKNDISVPLKFFIKQPDADTMDGVMQFGERLTIEAGHHVVDGQSKLVILITDSRKEDPLFSKSFPIVKTEDLEDEEDQVDVD